MRGAEQRTLPAAERRPGHRYRNRHVDADHADLHAAREFARHLAVAREARHAIPELVLVDQFDGARQIRHAPPGPPRPEDFVPVDGPVRRDIVTQHAAVAERVFVAMSLYAVTDDDELGPCLYTGLCVGFNP